MPEPLENLHIVLGITGSIAAYKAVDLASRLTKIGALVDVILTPSAEKFVAPLSFQSVTGRKAFTDADLWGNEGHVVHVNLGQSAQVYIIAPASANTIAKLANGIADNLLLDAALVANCPIIIAPAMETHMFNHPATQHNIQTLQSRGVLIIGPDEGHLASGASGLGRFVEPSELIDTLRFHFSRHGPLQGKRIVVSAGGTQEYIDPVRMITNRSSGRQGYAIAQAALNMGADVSLISAPTELPAPFGTEFIHVRTAREMKEAILQVIPNADVLIMAAAVADFRPKQPARQKIKKSPPITSIDLEPTDDILLLIGEQKKLTGKPAIIVGFAAESENVLENASKKIKTKNLDLIVANDITAIDSGFEVSTNRVTLLFADGTKIQLPVLSKMDVAEKILEIICSMENKLMVCK